MHDLTERQIQILKALIEEYINTAEAVGSETLEKKHNLSASPATIRNEMVKLSELGYLKKPHTSAGRVPTPLGMKFYVKQLMKEKDLSVAKEIAVKNAIWDYRERENQFLKAATRSLAEETGTLAITITRDGNMFAAGYANILNMPEFYDINFTKELLAALEKIETIENIIAQLDTEEDTHVLLGEELSPMLRGPYGCVFTRYTTPMDTKGEIGVLGPTRLNYTYIVPLVRYFGHLIEDSAKGW